MVYGFNSSQERMSLWNSLCEISDSIQHPWLIRADFNNVLNLEERVGSPVSTSEISDFKNYVGYCRFNDVQYKGCFYT